MDTSTAEAAKHISSRSGKRMRTLEEKRRIVEETFHSGESVAAIARRHEVNANLVFSWRRLYQKGLLEPAASSAALVPVKIEAAVVGTGTLGHPPIAWRSDGCGVSSMRRSEAECGI